MKERLRKNSLKFSVFSFQLIAFINLLIATSLISCTSNKKQETENLEQKIVYGCCDSCPEVSSDRPGNCPKCGMALKEKKEEPKKYVCEMFCDSLVFDKPGVCPVCKMDLVEQTAMNLHLPTLIKPVNQSVISTIRTIHPESKVVPITYQADGYVTYGTRTLDNISSRYSGRIEKLYLKYYFQHIEKGEKIFEIYSPEIVTVQENLINLLTNDTGSIELINSVKEKLLLLGLTEDQLVQIERTKTPFMLLPVYSPYEGHLHVMGNSTMVTGDNMENNLSSPELPVKQGMYVKKGQILFNLANPEKVWVTLRIYANDVSKVKLHQSVELTVDGKNDSIIGKIDLIEAALEAGAKNLNVRVNIPNHHHYLKMGLLMKAKITADSVDGVWIPKSAVIDLGKNKIVWIKKGDAFQARKIITGAWSGLWVEVLDGIDEENEIASDAQYLVDSESFVKIVNNENKNK